MRTSLLIFSMRAVGMTNDMVFIMGHIIRHDSALLTWILNLIIQFISCLQTELAIVKVSHKIGDCAFAKSCKVFFSLPEGQRTRPIILFNGIFNFARHASIQIHDEQSNRSCTFSGLVSSGQEIWKHHLFGPLRMLNSLLVCGLDTHTHTNLHKYFIINIIK